jgi:uncharacterized protein YdhG (YjbR/CyaY superfamily)
VQAEVNPVVTRKATRRPTKKATPVKTVDDYIAAAPMDKRAALIKLRRTIKSAAPKATESVSYGIVGYKQAGQRLVYFGYWKAHFALYGTGRSFIESHAAELGPYVQSKGTIQFPADKPIPVRLVTKIVKARVAEIEKATSGS